MVWTNIKHTLWYVVYAHFYIYLEFVPCCIFSCSCL